MNSVTEMVNTFSGLWAGQMWTIIWQSSVLAGLIVIVTLLFRRLSSAVKFWLWMLVPLRLLLMPLITISLPLLPAITSPQIEQVETTSPIVDTAALDYASATMESFEFHPGTFNNTPLQTRPVEIIEQKAEPEVIRVKPSIWSVLMIAWFTGVIFWTLRLLWSFRKIRRIVCNAVQTENNRIIEQVSKATEIVGLRNAPKILVTRENISPFLFGIFRPVLIVPSGFVNNVNNEGLLAVFSHEFAHLKRKDTLLGWILAICEVFYFFHPVLHFTKKRILFERERACDDWVIASGNSQKKTYANALIDAAGICRNFSAKLGPTGVVAESFGDLKKRIIAIGSNLKPKTRLSKTALVLLILIGTICVPGFVLTNRTIAASEKATLETVREMVVRNEALINPIKMEYTIKYEHKGELPSSNTGGGMRGSGRHSTHSEHTWAQDAKKNYAKGQNFYGPNELARGEIYIFDDKVTTLGTLPDLMRGEIRDHDRFDWYFVMIAKLGLRPFEGELRLSEILVSDYATLHKETEIVNGHKTYVVDAGYPPHSLYFARIWIDKQRGLPLRIWYYKEHPARTNQKTMSEINDIELYQLPNGAWLPIKGTRSNNLTTYISYEHVSVDVNSITTKKEDIPESLFEIDFPDGARVHNVFTGFISIKGQPLKTYEQIVEGTKNYIAGTIVDVNDVPVPDVVVRPQTIQVKQSDGRSSYRILQAQDVNCAVTDSTGRFAVELSEEGIYELVINPKDFVETEVRVPFGEHNLKVTLEKGGTIKGRVVRLDKGKKIPVNNIEVEVESERFVTLRTGRLKAVTDSDGRFEIKYLSTHLSPRNSEDTEYRPRPWQLRCGSHTQTVVFEQGVNNKEVEVLLRPDLDTAAPLIGKSLPSFDGIKLDYDINQAKDKKVLVCFFDLEQRPARNGILQLSKRVDDLAQQGISVIAVHVSNIEKSTIDAWLNENNITIPVGIVENDSEQIRFNWAVQSLPWLILTDSEHVVTDEGFSIDELDENISKVNSDADMELDDINFYRKEGLKTFFHADSIPEDIFNDPNEIAPDSLITIKTVDHEGKPVPYSRIVVVDQDDNETGRLYESATNEEGLAYFNIRDEYFSLNTHLYDYNPVTGEGRSQNHKIGQIYNRYDNNTVTVKWNPFPVGDCKVTGKVVDQYGKPITKYKLTLNYLEGIRTDWSESYSTYQSIQINDTEGRFEFGGLLPRKYSYMIYPETDTVYNWDFDMGNFTIPNGPNAVVKLDIEVEAKGLLYGKAFYQDGLPLDRGMWLALFEEDPQNPITHEHGIYFAERIDPNGFFAVTLSKKELEDLTECTGGNIEISDSSGTIGQIHIDKLSKELEQAPSFYFPRGKPKDTLVGLSLPELKNIKTDFEISKAKDKKVLVCFFDMEQRPSRNSLIELSTRVDDLAQEAISVIAVHASNIEKNTLDTWLKENNISFPIGIVEGDSEQIRFNWAIQSLPWLIMTDSEHIVTDEGFSIDELDEKLTSQNQDSFSEELLYLRSQSPKKIGIPALIKSLEKFISKYQEDSRVAEAWFYLGVAYDNDRNNDKALECYVVAAETATANTETWKKANSFVFARFLSRDIQQAEQILLKMKKHLNENDVVLEAEIETQYVTFYRMQKLFDEAEDHYSKVLELYKNRTKTTENIEDRVSIERCYRVSSMNLLASINNAMDLTPAQRLMRIKKLGEKYPLFAIFNNYQAAIKELESQVNWQDLSAEMEKQDNQR